MLVQLVLYYSRWFPSVFLYSTLAPFSLLLLFLLASYISPFLFYMGLGPKAAPFFSTFFYLFFQYIFPTQGLLVCSLIRRPNVPLQFIQACLDILYNIKVIFLLRPLHCSSFNIQLQGGILASFLSSTVAIYLYPPVILKRQAIQTF